MKYQEIRKKLIVEASVVVAIFAVLGGGVFYLNMVADDYQQEKSQLEAQLAQVTNERQALQNKYEKVQGNTSLYREVIEKNAADRLSISRQLLRKKVNDFKARYFLNDLTLNMSPVQEMTGNQYRYNSAVLVASELTANFDALTDEDIYSLVQALQDELSGTLKITQFTVSRVSKVTDESLRSIARNGQYSMVRGNIRFTWFGIKPLEPSLTGVNKQ